MQSPFDLSNPFRVVLMKYANDLLGDRYPLYHDLLTRLTVQIVTQKDASDFSQMMIDLFEKGFLKAVNDCKKATEAQGIKLKIVAEPIPKR